MSAPNIDEHFIAFARRHAGPVPPVPRGRRTVLTGRDLGAMPGAEDHWEEDAAEGTAAFIEYRDAAGDETQRRITIRRIDPRGHVHAWCHERGAPRIFAADGIRKVVDVTSGEIWQVPGDVTTWIDGLRGRLLASPAGMANEIVGRCRRGFVVLTFLARCDGHYHPSEAEVLTHFLADACFDLQFNADRVLEWANRLYPDTQTYERAVRGASFGGREEMRRVIRHARAMIDADGVMAPQEFEFARLLGETGRSD